MFGAILKGTNSSFKKGMTYCRSIYVKKVMKLLSFIFEQPSYMSHQRLRSILSWAWWDIAIPPLTQHCGDIQKIIILLISPAILQLSP